MHCNEYLHLLSGHLDHTNSDKEEKRLQGHLKTCKHCRELLAQMEANDLLLNDEAIVPPADLTDRIMAQVKTESRKRFNYRRFVPFTAAGLAAAAMFTLIISGRIPLLAGEKAAVKLPDDPLDSVTSIYADAEDYLASLDGLELPQNEAAPEHGTAVAEPQPTEAACPNNSAAEPTVCTGEPQTAPDVTEADDPADVQPTEAATEPSPTEQDAQVTEPTEAATEQPPTDNTTTTELPVEPSVEPPVPTEPPIPPEQIDLAANGRPKRGLTWGKATDASPCDPVLVIWNTDGASLSSYTDLEAVELKKLPSAADTSPLFSRFMQTLPLLEKALPENSLTAATNVTAHEFSVVAYQTSYATFNSAFHDFIGVCEIAAYYPATDSDYTQGLLILISKTTA